MILDTGICTLFRSADISDRGDMPTYAHTAYARGWYKALDYATSPQHLTDYAEDTVIAARIRIIQNRAVSVHDRVVLANTDKPDGYAVYSILRAWHGTDEDGELITDLTLEAVEA